jgi:beta-glucosidase-like glycosyl hydrolase
VVLDVPLIVPGIRLDRDAAKEEETALRRAREPWTAGFCLFGGEVEQVRRLLARLREAAGRPIFVASDMERGAGQQVRGLSVLPEAGAWGLAASPEEVEAFGEATAREAQSVGVDVLFAPVVDVRSEPRNPIVGNRSFGWDPDRVARLGAAFCRGALAGGAAPTSKHFPGHGGTDADSHDAVPVVREPAERVLARDFEPFVRLVREGGCPATMTAHVAYPSLDSTGRIATFSRSILDRLRRAVPDADDVAAFTDALLMAGAREEGGEVGAARSALLAGCDLLLYPEDPETVAAALLSSADEERRLRPAVDAAVGRARALLGRIAIAAAEARRRPAPDAAVPGRVVRRALEIAGGAALPRERDWLLVLDDDGVRGRGLALAEAGRRASVPVSVVDLASGARPPETSPVRGGWTVVVMASIRAWKGASGVSPVCAEIVDDLVDRARESGSRCSIVWLTPAAGPGGVHLPATGPDVEAALAEVLFR